ncbi:MAG TPA: branched-chain amino acid ABC transporter permease [Kofleriaceae bacterium]|jgi:branched-chain amino acid transport system permease protein|nr:branched-chain amino acid ABC transporter permease [Kofleriaceae bacterium]
MTSRHAGWLRAAITAALVIILVACPAWGSDGARATLIVFAYYAGLAQMWNLLAGYAGLVTFGQQLFIGIGGYTLAVGAERLGLGMWPSFALAAVVAGALAVPVGALTFRLKGGYFAVGSWLVAEVFRLAVGNSAYLGNASGMFIRPARTVDPWTVYYLAIGLLIALVALVVVTLRSRAGIALMAIRDAEDAAAGLGVHVWRLKLLAFVVAAAGTGLVAALITVQTPFIQPNAAFSIEWSASASFMVVVGGLGTVEGPLVGAAVYVVLQDMLGATGEIHLIVLGAVSVVVMLVAPRGITGFLRDRLGWTLFPVARHPPRVAAGSTTGSRAA